MIKKLFSLIYFLFSIFLIFAMLWKRSFSEVSVIAGCTILIFFFLKKIKLKFRFDDRLVNLLLILGIIIRISLIFLPFGKWYSDYANFYYTAISFSQNGTIGKYVASFPHLMPFIVTLGSLFKLFGASFNLVVIFNIIFDLISAFFIKKLFNSKKAALLWMFNPINIIWCCICHPAVITNTFLIISIFILKKIIDKFDLSDKKICIYVVLLGLVLAIANLYRPIMIILIIATIIYFGLNLKKNNLKKIIVIILVMVVSFFGFNKMFSYAGRVLIDNTITTQTVGYNIYLGANISSNGSWNQRQQDEFDEIFYTDATPTEIQEYFFEKGIELYKVNGINNVKFFIKKAVVLVKDPDLLTVGVLNNILKNPLNEYVMQILKVLVLVTYYLLLLFNLIISYVSLKNNECGFTILLQLFVIGIVTSHMFVEVASRYSLPLLVPYTLLIIINKKKIKNIFSKK